MQNTWPILMLFGELVFSFPRVLQGGTEESRRSDIFSGKIIFNLSHILSPTFDFPPKSQILGGNKGFHIPPRRSIDFELACGPFRLLGASFSWGLGNKSKVKPRRYFMKNVKTSMVKNPGGRVRTLPGLRGSGVNSTGSMGSPSAIFGWVVVSPFAKTFPRPSSGELPETPLFFPG